LTDSTGDKFTDSIAFARCVFRSDWEGLEMIIKNYENPLDILVPQAWILNAAIGRLAQEMKMEVDEVWGIMIESVGKTEKGLPPYED